MRAAYCCLLTVFLAGILFCPRAQAEEQVQIFPLKYRSADEIAPRVSPLLLDGERVSAAENHLVLIASPETIEAVGKLIEVMDRQLKQYSVQVRWLDGPVTSTGRLGFDAASGKSQLPGGGRVLGTETRQGGQVLRVTEGVEAYIVTGSDVPYSSRWAAWSGRFSSGTTNQVAFKEIRSGFQIRVLPTADGQLQVHLTPQLMQSGQGEILNPVQVTLDRLETSAQLKPGVWTDIGHYLPDVSTGLQILSGSEDPLPSGRQLQLRIDEQK